MKFLAFIFALLVTESVQASNVSERNVSYCWRGIANEIQQFFNDKTSHSSFRVLMGSAHGVYALFAHMYWEEM